MLQRAYANGARRVLLSLIQVISVYAPDVMKECSKEFVPSKKTIGLRPVGLMVEKNAK